MHKADFFGLLEERDYLSLLWTVVAGSNRLAYSSTDTFGALKSLKTAALRHAIWNIPLLGLFGTLIAMRRLVVLALH